MDIGVWVVDLLVRAYTSLYTALDSIFGATSLGPLYIFAVLVVLAFRFFLAPLMSGASVGQSDTAGKSNRKE